MIVCLSYRRQDSEGTTGGLYRDLRRILGKRHVFMDRTGIEAATRFEDEIRGAIERCHVVIVVIGNAWLTATNKEGELRLWRDDDLVRREIELALKAGKKIIPLLIDGAVMPDRHQFPESIADLASWQATELRNGREYDDDLDRLVKRIRALLPARKLTRRVILATGGGFLALAAAFLISLFLFQKTPSLVEPDPPPDLPKADADHPWEPGARQSKLVMVYFNNLTDKQIRIWRFIPARTANDPGDQSPAKAKKVMPGEWRDYKVGASGAPGVEALGGWSFIAIEEVEAGLSWRLRFKRSHDDQIITTHDRGWVYLPFGGRFRITIKREFLESPEDPANFVVTPLTDSG